MAKNYADIRVYGDFESEVFFAPTGTTLPTDITADPPPPFVAVGWISEDGVGLTVTTDVTKFKGWQGGTTLRTKVTSSEKSFKVQCLQETPTVTELFYGHGPATVTGTAPNEVAKIDLPESIHTVSRAAVVKFVDGTVTKFLVCERVEVTARGELAHQNASMTMYELTLEIIGNSYILTNADSYIP